MDYGDLGSVPGYVEESFQVIQEEIQDLFAHGVIPSAIGGDHSVTLPETESLQQCLRPCGPGTF